MARFDAISRIYDLLPIPNHPRRFRRHLAGVEGPRLDLGGGTGRTTALLHGDAGGPVVVLDPSEGMLRQGRRMGRPHEGILGVGQRMPFPDATFAAVTVTEAFHHFARHQGDVLAEVRRVLRDDGVFLVEEIDPTRLPGRAIELGERMLRFGSRFLMPEELADVMRLHFADVSTERTGPFTYLVVARAARRR